MNAEYTTWYVVCDTDDVLNGAAIKMAYGASIFT